MKRFITIVLALALLFALCACGGAESESVAAPAPSDAVSPADTASPVVEAEPETDDATVLIDRLGAVFKTLEDGQELQITGESGEYYLFELEGVKLMAEKRFIRLASDTPFEERTGYTGGETPVYADIYLSGDALEVLPLNTELSVIDDLGSCLKLRLEDGSVAFARAEQINSYRSGYQSGSGGGNAPSTKDGGNIDISTIAKRATAQEAPIAVSLGAEAKTVYPAAGTVLADSVEAYLAVFERGDAVKYTEKDEASARLLIDGEIGTVPAMFLRVEGEAEYETWSGFAKTNTRIFGGWRMSGDAQDVGVNTPVLVLEDFGELCYVQWQKGHGFMLREEISERPILPLSSGSGGADNWTAPVK